MKRTIIKLVQQTLCAALGLIEFLPYLGFGLLAGAVADRMKRKKIMVGCDLVAAFLLAVVPAAPPFG